VLQLNELDFSDDGGVTPRIDPFCEIKLGDHRVKTSKCSKPLFGSFAEIQVNETFELYEKKKKKKGKKKGKKKKQKKNNRNTNTRSSVVKDVNQVLHVQVWNRDLFDEKAHKFLGQLALNVSSVVQGKCGEEPQLCKLRKRGKKDKVSGSVRLIVCYKRKLQVGAPQLLSSSKSAADSAAAAAAMDVNIDSGDLSASGSGSGSAPNSRSGSAIRAGADLCSSSSAIEPSPMAISGGAASTTATMTMTTTTTTTTTTAATTSSSAVSAPIPGIGDPHVKLSSGSRIEMPNVALASLGAAASGINAASQTRYTPRRKKGIFKGGRKKNRMVFGKPFDVDTKVVPEIIEQTVDYLFYPSALRTEGLFRVAAARADVNELRADWEYGNDIERDACPDPHVVGGLLMSYLLEMPEPLVPFDSYDGLLAADEYVTTGERERVQVLKRIFDTMPSGVIITLDKLFGYLASLAEYDNKMSTKNIAIVFGPVLMRKREESPMQIVQDSPVIIRIVCAVIDHYEYFFKQGEINEPALERAVQMRREDEQVAAAMAVRRPGGKAPAPALVALAEAEQQQRGAIAAPTLSPRSRTPPPPRSRTPPGVSSTPAASTAAAPEPAPPGLPKRAPPPMLSAAASGSLSPRVPSLPPPRATSNEAAAAAPLPIGRNPVSSAAQGPPRSRAQRSASAASSQDNATRRVVSQPERFFSLQAMVLTAVSACLVRFNALRAELDDSVAPMDRAHVAASQVLASAACAVLDGSPSAPPSDTLFEARVEPSGDASDPHHARAQVLATLDRVQSMLKQRTSSLQDDALLLEPKEAIRAVIASGRTLRRVGAMLDNYQQRVRPLSRSKGSAGDAADVERLRTALVGALEGIRAKQLARIKLRVRTVSSLKTAVATAHVVRTVEKALVDADNAPASLGAPPALSPAGGEQPTEAQRANLDTLCEVIGYGLAEIDSRLSDLVRLLGACEDKSQMMPVATLLRAVGVYLDAFLQPPASPSARAGSPGQPAAVASSSSSSPPPPPPRRSLDASSSAAAAAMVASPRGPELELSSARQDALNSLQEVQSNLNNLRIELENTQSQLAIVTISRIAAFMKKIMHEDKTLSRRDISASFRKSVVINDVSTLSDNVLNGLRARSSTVLDEARAFVFAQRRIAAKARTVAELGQVQHRVHIIADMSNLYTMWNQEGFLKHER
jgi:RhoGAP domain/C2 domain